LSAFGGVEKEKKWAKQKKNTNFFNFLFQKCLKLNLMLSVLSFAFGVVKKKKKG
jgi:hypothetical protein